MTPLLTACHRWSTSPNEIDAGQEAFAVSASGGRNAITFTSGAPLISSSLLMKRMMPFGSTRAKKWASELPARQSYAVNSSVRRVIRNVQPARIKSFKRRWVRSGPTLLLPKVVGKLCRALSDFARVT